MSNNIKASPLGKETVYTGIYAPEQLHPIARNESREKIAIKEHELPFKGVDVWTGFELSWLNARGLPQVAVAEFFIPCASPNIVESKSFKLYLNSFNQTRFQGQQAVLNLLQKDLSCVVGAEVDVKLYAMDKAASLHVLSSFNEAPFTAELLDGQDIEINNYHPDPTTLCVEKGESIAECLYSNLLKTNCPVTSQPDWASICIDYRGAKINREGLLRYIVSFREHQDFHEHCVERIFSEILQYCQPELLSVYARYTRRGGLDINPFRSTHAERPLQGRLLRQ